MQNARSRWDEGPTSQVSSQHDPAEGFNCLAVVPTYLSVRRVGAKAKTDNFMSLKTGGTRPWVQVDVGSWDVHV
jgi:hypothetical protein